MIGTNMEELKQYLKSKTDTDTADCICEYTVPSGMISEDDIINDFLNTKCFEGKSFVEIETAITVDVIF